MCTHAFICMQYSVVVVCALLKCTLFSVSPVGHYNAFHFFPLRSFSKIQSFEDVYVHVGFVGIFFLLQVVSSSMHSSILPYSFSGYFLY